MKEWRVGERVAGYELLAELGRGGMGVVFRARELATGRELALKTLTFLDPEEASRLQREGEALARLEHPNLLRVYGAGEHAGRPYLALELAAGGSLAERLEREPRLDWRAACDLVAPLARALAAAHGVGLVHRDLKPGNVLLDEQGRAKLADFGLVRLDDRSRLTETGTLLGTPLYMAPEQGRGEPAGPPADVYSLAALLYRCVAGRPPIAQQASVLAQLVALQDEEPEPLSRGLAPPWLARLLARALSKDPRARPEAAELAAALEAREGAAAPSGSPLVPALLLGTIGVGLLGLLGLLAKGSRSGPPPDPPLPRVSASLVSTAEASATPADSIHVISSALVVARLDAVAAELRASNRELSAALEALGPLETRTVAAAAHDFGALLLDREPPRGIAREAAVLELARRGLHGWIPSVVEQNYLKRTTDSLAGQLLRASAARGDLRALHLVSEEKSARAAAWAYLGWSGQLIVTPKAVEKGFEARRPHFAGLFPRSPAAALAQLWRSEPLGPEGSELRRAAPSLVGEPERTLERYLRCWQERPELRGDRFAEELQRCAEIVALPGL